MWPTQAGVLITLGFRVMGWKPDVGLSGECERRRVPLIPVVSSKNKGVIPKARAFTNGPNRGPRHVRFSRDGVMEGSRAHRDIKVQR